MNFPNPARGKIRTGSHFFTKKRGFGFHIGSQWEIREGYLLLCPNVYTDMDIGRMFLVGNEWFVWVGFPSWEGIKGCVTVRSAAGDEMFLLLFGWGSVCQILGDCFGFRRLCADVTHPRPLSRGEIEMCDGEKRGLGWDVFAAVFWGGVCQVLDDCFGV